MSSSSDSSNLYTSLFNLVHLAPSANATLPPHPHLQTSYPPFCPFCISFPCTHLLQPLMFLAVFLYLLPHLPLTPSGFFNAMLEVSKPSALKDYTLSHLILLAPSVSKNPTLTHLPLSGSLDTLLCDLIALTPGLAFFLLMTCRLAASSSFLPGRAYPSLNFLLPLSLCLTPTLMV